MSAENPFARNVPRLYAIRFCYWFHTVAAILVPFFRDWGGIPLGRILLLNAWFMLWNFLLELPTGSVADRFGRRVSLTLGTALGALGTLVYVAAPRFEVFLLAEIVFALSYTLCSGADEALLYDSLGGREAAAERAPRAFARLESCKLAGIVAGALLGSLLATQIGLRATLAFQALPIALGCALTFTLREPPRRGTGGAQRSYLAILRDGLRHLASERALRPLVFESAAIGALVFLVIWLYQPLLEAAGVGLGAFGSVHVAMTLGQIAVIGSLGRLAALFGSRRALLRGLALLAGAGFVLLGVARDSWAVVPLVVATASFGLARTPILTSAMNLHIPSAHRATVLSAVSGLRTLGIVIVNGAASLGVGRSLHATVMGLGAGVLLLGLLSPVREQHLHASDR